MNTKITAASTVEQVVKYIQNLRLFDEHSKQTYSYAADAASFLQQVVSGKVFLSLGLVDLNELGIVQLRKRNLLFAHILQIKAYTTPPRQLQQPQQPPLPIHNSPLHTSSDEWSSCPSTQLDELLIARDKLQSVLSMTMPYLTHDSPSLVSVSESSAFKPTQPRWQTPQRLQTPQSIILHSHGSHTSSGPPSHHSKTHMESKTMTTTTTPPQGTMMPKPVNIVATADPEVFKVACVYQGINSYQVAFVLMSECNIRQLNQVYHRLSSVDFAKGTKVSNNNDVDCEMLQEFQSLSLCGGLGVDPVLSHVANPNTGIRTRDPHNCVQTFHYRLKTEKLRYGWLIGNRLKIPFNPLVVCTVNVRTDQILDVQPMIISGTVNHISDHGSTWVTSDVEIQATEEVKHGDIMSTGNIVRLELNDISHRSLQDRNASYLIHDPDKIDSQQNHRNMMHPKPYNHTTWKKGSEVHFNLKLSTRTNKKFLSSSRPVFVQAYNVQ